MAPHLLNRPAEIRNVIYEYALTAEAGLFYFEDSTETGALYTHTGGWYMQIFFRKHLFYE